MNKTKHILVTEPVYETKIVRKGTRTVIKGSISEQFS